MSYPETVEYLYALGNELKPGASFGLERMQTLMRVLGHPDRRQTIVHVAGTNGKGSTCAMIAQVLSDAGYKTGLNTSPHLVEPTERIQTDCKPVSHEEFAAAFDVVHAAAEKAMAAAELDAHPSYFETVTAMALHIFAQHHCEYTVLEVGLGGRLDATNVVRPRLCVITPVSFDHEAFLGNTLAAIASEKAGILKPGVPAVIADQEPAAEQVLLARAGQLGCPVMRAHKSDARDLHIERSGATFRLGVHHFSCSLPGPHQVGNAITAIVACRALGIADETIATGLSHARWPGRLETVRLRPDFILDGAHNPAGARALAQHIREFYSDRPVWLVYGAMRDKALDEVMGELFPLAQKLIFTRPAMSRALQPETILALYDHLNAVTAGNLRQAIVLAQSAPPEAAVFFTGSLYLVGEARRLLLPLE